jgi:hypothetical protein
MARALVALAALALAGCEDGTSAAAGATSATSTTSKSAAPTASAATTAATAAPKAAEPPPTCPDPAMKLGGEPDKGWDYTWCESTGNVRMMEAKVKEVTDEGVTVSVTNKSAHGVATIQAYLFVYDASGKQLDIAPKVAGPPPRKSADCSLNKTPYVKPGETVELKCLKHDVVPKGATVEAEVTSLNWGIDGRFLKWKNPTLDAKERPKGGVQ